MSFVTWFKLSALQALSKPVSMQDKGEITWVEMATRTKSTLKCTLDNLTSVSAI